MTAEQSVLKSGAHFNSCSSAVITRSDDDYNRDCPFSDRTSARGSGTLSIDCSPPECLPPPTHPPEDVRERAPLFTSHFAPSPPSTRRRDGTDDGRAGYSRGAHGHGQEARRRGREVVHLHPAVR